MFKKFEAKESIVGSNQMKNSVQRAFRNKLIETYPNIEVRVFLYRTPSNSNIRKQAFYHLQRRWGLPDD